MYQKRWRGSPYWSLLLETGWQSAERQGQSCCCWNLIIHSTSECKNRNKTTTFVNWQIGNEREGERQLRGHMGFPSATSFSTNFNEHYMTTWTSEQHWEKRCNNMKVLTGNKFKKDYLIFNLIFNFNLKAYSYSVRKTILWNLCVSQQPKVNLQVVSWRISDWQRGNLPLMIHPSLHGWFCWGLACCWRADSPPWAAGHSGPGCPWSVYAPPS